MVYSFFLNIFNVRLALMLLTATLILDTDISCKAGT